MTKLAECVEQAQNPSTTPLDDIVIDDMSPNLFHLTLLMREAWLRDKSEYYRGTQILLDSVDREDTPAKLLQQRDELQAK